MHRPKHRKVLGRVREMCLALPDTAEKISRGHIPVITVKGKNFAMLWRADGRPNVCLSVPPGAQGVLVEADPDRYFVPAYVGVRGWVGVRLDGDVDWETLGQLAADAHAHAAPVRAALRVSKRTSRRA